MLTFDASAHTYTLTDAVGQQRLLSVTGVIRRAGYLDDLTWFGNPDALRRGRLVHALSCAVDALGWENIETPINLPPSGLVVPRALITLGPLNRLQVYCPADLIGYMRAYVEVRRLYRTRWDFMEEPVARADLQLAGTPDRIGIFNGAATVVEVKTGAWAPWHGYQLSGYDLLCPLPFKRRRVGVYLRPDGDFRIRRYEDDEDYQRFVRALGDAREDPWR